MILYVMEKTLANPHLPIAKADHSWGKIKQGFTLISCSGIPPAVMYMFFCIYAY